MKQRTCILLLAVMLLAGFSLPQTAHSLTLKIATAAPEGSKWVKDMRAASKEIEQRTEGRVKFKLYGGGVMGNTKSVLRKMRVGQLHGGAFTMGAMSAIVPDTLLYSLPFLYRDLNEVKYVRKQLDPYIIDMLDKKGYICFGVAGGGFGKIMSNTPIRSEDDLKNRKIWVPEGDEVGYAVMSEMGLSPVTLPLVDVMTGLQTGLLDIVAGPPTAALVFQWYTRIKFITNTPLVYIAATMVLDKRIFKRMKAEDQAVVKEIMSKVYVTFDQDGEKDDEAAIEALKEQGIQFVELNPGVADAWRKIAFEVEGRLADQGLYSRKLFDNLTQCMDGCPPDWSLTK